MSHDPFTAPSSNVDVPDIARGSAVTEHEGRRLFVPVLRRNGNSTRRKPGNTTAIP